MRDKELQFDRTCHVLYSKPCKKQIQTKIALHYPAEEREAIWERVQQQYVDFLRNWRTDLGGKKNFHNGAGGNYDCIALMAYYVVCRDVTSLAEIEEMEGELFLSAFRKMKFVDCNRPLFKKLLYRLLQRQKAVRGCMWRLTIRISPSITSSPPTLRRSLPKSTVCWRSCLRCATRF